MEAGPAPLEDSGYTGASVAGAVLATLFFPLIALIVALLLLGGQTDPRKRQQLRQWAWVTGGWLAFWTLMIVFAFVGFATGSSGQVVHFSRPGGQQASQPCSGGPKIGAPGYPVAGSKTKFAVPCAFGGTATITMPSP